MSVLKLFKPCIKILSETKFLKPGHFTKIIRRHKSEVDPTLVRHRFHPECENKLNDQINKELYASYVYLTLAFHFDQAHVALSGFHHYFLICSEEENEHAQKFLYFQTKRGGCLHFCPIQTPPEKAWNAPMAIHEALKLEKLVTDSILELHELATKHGDATLTDFLEGQFLDEQFKAIKELTDLLTQTIRVGKGVGLHLLDGDVLDMAKKKRKEHEEKLTQLHGF